MANSDNLTMEAACAALAAAAAHLVAVLREGRDAEAPCKVDEICTDAGSSSELAGAAQSGSERGDAADDVAPGQLCIYMAGARGLAELTRAHGGRIMAALGLDAAPYVAKVGTATVPLQARLRQIGQDQYGGAVRAADGAFSTEPGFSRWMVHAIAPSREPRDPAVTVSPRAIRADLPAGLTRRAFDGALHRALAKRALDGLPASIMPRRFTAYDLGAVRLSAATEFYALSPHVQADADLLLDAIEGILRRHRAGRGRADRG